MHRVVFSLAAVGCLAGSLSWLARSHRAVRRAHAAEHAGRHAPQWHSIAAKDRLVGALMVSLVPIMAAQAIQGQVSSADWLVLVAVVPLLLSLAWIRRFNRLAELIEAESDFAQRQRERAGQEHELAGRIAQRLDAPNVETPAGLLLRTLYHPAEGVVGGDFLGTGTAGDEVLFVVGDVIGHGLDAAINALRVKDLVLTAMLTGAPLPAVLALANTHLCADPSGEALATVFVARYGSGVLRYVNAGHLPGHLFDGGTDQPLPPSGPLLGLLDDPTYEERQVALEPGFRLVVYTDGLLDAYGRLGGLGDQEVVEIIRQGEFALLHERLNARRPEPLRDDIAAIELLLPSMG